MARPSLLDAAQIYPQRHIYLDYLAGAEELAPFYKYYPANQRTLSERMEQLAHQKTSRPTLGQALLEYNQQIGAASLTLENAKLLSDGQALAVVTGQQAGFAGGPLYNVYKAITAIKLAQHLSQTTGQPVVPVFWIASEDTNVDQINQSTWMDPQGQLQHIRADLGQTGQQVCSLTVQKSAIQAFEQLAQLMPQSEFRSRWQGVYEPFASEPWGQWFGRIYAQLFAEHGLVMLEPHILYSQAGQIFKRIIANLPQLKETFAKTTAKLSEAGYKPQIDGPGRAMLYYVNHDHQRQPIDEEKELIDLAQAHPERFSCSVKIRPLVQEHLLPTVAYVAGPGEVSYYAQLRGLYEQLELGMPVIWPRASMTLVEPKIARLIAKSPTAQQDLFTQDQPDQSPPLPQAEAPGSEVLIDLAKKAGDSLERLANKIKTQDRSAQKFADKTSKRAQRDIERLLRRGLEFLNLDQQITRRQYERMRMSLRPAGKPQERAFSLFGYLVYYGPAVLEQIIQAVDVFDFHHRLVYLDFGVQNNKQETMERKV